MIDDPVSAIDGPASPAPASLRNRPAKAVRAFSLASLAMVALAVAILWLVSEETWWGTVLTFMPRHVFLLGPILLLMASLVWDRISILVNILALALAAGPLMGARLPLWSHSNSQSPEPQIKIVSCNVNRYHPDFETTLREISSLGPDVVALQEAPIAKTLLPRYFPGWHVVHEDEFWVGSRFPLRRLNLCPGTMPRHPTVLSVRIETPQGAFDLHNVHLTTPRFGILQLTMASVFDGSGPRIVETSTADRLAEALDASACIEQCARKHADPKSGALPTLVAGDFNTPTESVLYRCAWHRFANAFDRAGWGFGYTAPCTEHRYWPDGAPWARIDHILADESWSVSTCTIGGGAGSDHRLIWAVLSLRKVAT